MMTHTMSSNANANVHADRKTLVVVCYVLFILGVVNGLTAVAGVIVAHLKRGGSAGTVWHSHYDNMIRVFWISLFAFAVGWVLKLVLIGFVVLGVLAVWYLYRTIRGLILASEARPYA
jgi:uncharacterized membrane protein